MKRYSSGEEKEKLLSFGESAACDSELGLSMVGKN